MVLEVRTTEDLIRIAVAANQGGSQIYFSGLSVRSTDDLIRISTAGKGAVEFED